MSDNASLIEILIQDDDHVLRPGEMLRGGYRLTATQPVFAEKAELSVLWYTEGRGDEAVGVIHHETVAKNQQLGAQDAFPFEVKLPLLPWSYDGKLIKIRWAVRVRIFPDKGDEIAGEQRFFLLPEGRSAPSNPGKAKDSESNADS